MDSLKDSRYSLRFEREQEKPVPERVVNLFTDKVRTLLQIDVGGLVLNCHFFDAKEIEFDLDPREIESEREGQAVLEFMRWIGGVLGKPIRLTPENMQEIVLIEYDPASDEFREKSDWHDVFGAA